MTTGLPTTNHGYPLVDHGGAANSEVSNASVVGRIQGQPTAIHQLLQGAATTCAAGFRQAATERAEVKDGNWHRYPLTDA